MSWVQPPFVSSLSQLFECLLVWGTVLNAGGKMVRTKQRSLCSPGAQSPVWFSLGFLTTWWLSSRRTPKARFPANQEKAAWPFMTSSQKLHIILLVMSESLIHWDPRGWDKVPISQWKKCRGHIEEDHVGWERDIVVTFEKGHLTDGRSWKGCSKQIHFGWKFFLRSIFSTQISMN